MSELQDALQQYNAVTAELEAQGHYRLAEARDHALVKLAQQPMVAPVPQQDPMMPYISQLTMMVQRLNQQVMMQQVMIQKLMQQSMAPQSQPAAPKPMMSQQPMSIDLPPGANTTFNAGNASELNINAQG